MPAPSWFLLVWVGVASTCAAGITGSLLGGRRARSWALHPRPRSAAQALIVTALLGLVAYAVAYGLLFEWTGRSDMPFGLVVGFAHGAVAFALGGPRAQPAVAVRLWAMHFAYGGTAAFLYVTP